MNRLYLFFLIFIVIPACRGQEKEKLQSESGIITSIEEKQKRFLQNLPDTLGNEVKNQKWGFDFRAAAKKVTPGVVNIKSTWIDRQSNKKGGKEFDPFRDFFDDEFGFPKPEIPVQGNASGVIITDDGYIVTNNHVIEDADEIEVTLHDTRSYKAKVIGADPLTDLALIKIEENNLSFIEFGNSDDVEVGEWVLAVGNPFNLSSTVTAGIVSAKARNINILRNQGAIESFIQTDAAVNPGNSGGALVDLEGKLVGINSAIATPTGAYAGYSFAIPVDIAKKIIDDLLNFGVVQRGYIGIIIRDMSGNLAKELGISSIRGVYVDSIIKGSAAEEAGIKEKDVIIQIDKHKIERVPELQEIIGRHRPGEKINIVLIRNGKEKQLTVILKNVEGTTQIVKKEHLETLKVLGIEVEELSAKEKRLLDMESGLKVVRIYSGKIQKHTNMQEGFIIIKVNNITVKTKQDIINALEGKKGGVMLEGRYPDFPGTYYYAFGM